MTARQTTHRTTQQATAPHAPADLAGMVAGTLALLQRYSADAGRLRDSGKPLQSLLDQCRARAAAIEARPPEPLRVIHHFACTGGTLLSRTLACQPNALVLSEVDPFSTMGQPVNGFAPTDLLYLARQTHVPPDADVVAAVFLAQLEALFEAMRRQGRHLIVRDHTHSHFCTTAALDSRPLMGALLAGRFALRQVVSVRHPLDAFASLHKNGWIAFSPATLEEFCARHLAFLAAYSGVPVFHYEHFAADPEARARGLCDLLALDHQPDWQDILPTVTLSGDSGRKGDTIALRPRRPLPEALLAQAGASPAYAALCDALGYDPDPQGTALPRGAA